MGKMEVETLDTRHQPVRYVDIDGQRWYRQNDIFIIPHLKIDTTKVCRKERASCKTIAFSHYTNGGMQTATFLDSSSLEFLAHRTGNTSVREILLDIGVKVPTLITRFAAKEYETTAQIEQCIPLGWAKQYRIVNYRLDMYLPKYNIVVECDEAGHSTYDKIKDQKRTEIVNAILKNPIWIRYNPDEPDFNVNLVIGKIVKIIASS